MLAGFLALAAWAFASPVGSSPDDDFHLISIWCAGGESKGMCEPGSTPESRTVPDALVSVACFAFNPAETANCQSSHLDLHGAMVETTRGNFVGAYPGQFYATMHLLSGDNVQVSVLLMRLFNAAVFVLALLAVCLALPKGLSRAATWGSLVAMVPLGIFIIPSTNPSSWALTSAAITFVSVVSYISQDDRRRRYTAGGLAVIGVALAASARADAALYGVLAIGVALIVTFRWARTWALRTIVPIVLAAISMAAFFSTGQSSVASQGFTGDTAAPQDAIQLVSLFVEVPSLWIGALGYWGLGWIDTGLPSLVWIAAGAAFAGTLTVALPGINRLQRLACFLLLAALWAIPMRVLWLSGAGVGQQVQPRYLLPLLMATVVVALARFRGPGFAFRAPQSITLGVLLIVANSVALHTNLRRYLTGNDVRSLDLNADIEWWWNLPISPMAVWLVGTLAFAGAVLLVAGQLRTHEANSDRLELRRGLPQAETDVTATPQSRTESSPRPRRLLPTADPQPPAAE